jgi:transcriptional regulator with XRE-family HTH domain
MLPDVAKAITDLATFRKMRGVSIEQITELSEINLRTLFAYKRGDRVPSAMTLSRWAAELGCQIMFMPKQE